MKVISRSQAKILAGGSATNASSLHTHKMTTGQASRGTSAGTGTQNIAHGLGVIPKLIKITATRRLATNTGVGTSHGTATSTSNDSAIYWYIIGTIELSSSNGSNIVSVYANTGGGNQPQSEASLSALDATNITLNFGTHVNNSGDLFMQWEAYS